MSNRGEGGGRPPKGEETRTHEVVKGMLSEADDATKKARAAAEKIEQIAASSRVKANTSDSASSKDDADKPFTKEQLDSTKTIVGRTTSALAELAARIKKRNDDREKK